MAVVSLSVKEQGAGGWTGEISISLTASGLELKQRIAEVTKIAPENQKLLCIGKFLKNELSLQDQGVKAASKIMVMKIAREEIREVQKVEADNAHAQSQIDKTVQVAEELASRTSEGLDNDYYFELRNQNGQPVELPTAERQLLVTGMTLHEKAKSLIQESDFKAALELLLKADNAFSRCKDDFVQQIDNWAFVNLDICWAYFKLKDLNYLKDANWRLQKAREGLDHSYGRNLERLNLIRSEARPELVFFLRMYLLQGIVAFHAGQRSEARAHFERAREHLETFRIDDTLLAEMISMGFTARECRVALRAAKNQDQAISFILQKREERKKQREEEERDRRARRYGKTANGQLIDLDAVDALEAMGFAKPLVIAGLKQTNNNQEHTLQLLLNNPQLLEAAIARDDPISEEKVLQLTSLGFSRLDATRELQLTNGNVARALEQLFLKAPIASPAPVVPNAVPNAVEPPPSNNRDEVMEDTPMTEAEIKAQEERRQKSEIERDLLDAVPINDDEYFDVDLSELEGVLREYSVLVA